MFCYVLYAQAWIMMHIKIINGNANYINYSAIWGKSIWCTILSLVMLFYFIFDTMLFNIEYMPTPGITDIAKYKNERQSPFSIIT